MPILFRPSKIIKKKKTKNAQEILKKLEDYLKGNCDEPIKILCGFWKDQQDAITYQELREAVIQGHMNEETFRLWSQDYSIMIADKFKNVWEDAMAAGAISQPVMQGLPFNFDMEMYSVKNWISERGAKFVTSSTVEQRKAIQTLLSKKAIERYTVDELSRMIRPCIGLTESQTKANMRYYNNIVDNLKKEHPRMKEESVKKKALDASTKYAERQHRQRAMTIAQTEMAFAYNWGADETTRQAQDENLLGKTVKRWCTSGDARVCSTCEELDGIEIEMDKDFSFKGKVLFPGQHMLPPAHPRCACAVEYIEVEPPVVTDTVRERFDVPNVENTQQYKEVKIDEEDVRSEQRGKVDISARKVVSANNNVYVSDSVKLKRRQLHEMDTGISEAVKKLEISDSDSLPAAVIISISEMQTGALAAYNPYKNVLYVNEYAGNRKVLLESQETFAGSENDISTYVHELIHWMDAEQYRTLYGKIDENYMTWLRKKCKKKLEELSKSGYNIYEISKYASEMLDKEKYDEVYTEYRVKQILGGI